MDTSKASQTTENAPATENTIQQDAVGDAERLALFFEGMPLDPNTITPRMYVAMLMHIVETYADSIKVMCCYNVFHYWMNGLRRLHPNDVHH